MLKIHLYNTLTRKKEVFTSIQAGKIKMYVCGPTVYDRAHIGNARSAVVFDTFYRFFAINYKITYVRNITDIDDKIIIAAQNKSRSIREITEETTKFYHDDMRALGVLPPTIEPKATEHIAEMIAVIKQLITTNHAYYTHKHVLFDTSSCANYGQLSGRNIDEMIAGARVELTSYKKNPQDFVLWKPSDKDIIGWESPWGRGRPGWHIECSAMINKHLGKNFDIHGGGSDLLFPHHENELTQSQCANKNEKFANFWLHNGMLLIQENKMSKSLGNIITVEHLLQQSRGEVIRMAILSTHYRQPLNWQEHTLQQANASLNKLYKAITDYRDKHLEVNIDPQFISALADDLNTSLAIARLHEMAKHINKEISMANKQKLQAVFIKSAAVMGLLSSTSQKIEHNLNKCCAINTEQINKLIEQRALAKKQKNFALADQIRSSLQKNGIILEDTVDITKWRIK